MDEKPKSILKNPRAIFSRLFKIALILFPVSYIVFALLVSNWFPFATDEESTRHIVQWLILLAVGISITFLVSLLELKGPRGFLTLFALLFGVGFMVIFSIGRNHSPAHPVGESLFFSFLYAICWALIGILFITFIRWLCCGRNFKRFLFGGACFATLVALFYAEEDWRGWHDWSKFKRAQEAKGEKFDWQSIVPPPVPDDQNFAFSPVWIAEDKFNFRNTPERAKIWYGDRINSEEVAKISPLIPVTTSTVVGTNAWSFPNPPDDSSGWNSCRFLDLKPFQSYYRNLGKTNSAAEIIITPQPRTPAQDVLLALSKFDPIFEQLRQDSRLPYSRFPVQYDTDDPAAILLPHLGALKRYSQVLQLRAVAELQNGETDQAFDDVKLMLHFIGSAKTEPFIITHLVRIAILQTTLQPIWEGLAEHKWSDAQLAEMDSELAKLDFLADYNHSFHANLAATDVMIDYIEKKPSRFLIFTQWGSDQLKKKLNRFSVAVEIYLMPKGWWEQNKIVVFNVSKQFMFPVVDEAQRTVSPQKCAGAEKFQNSLQPTPFNLLATVLAWPGIGSYAQKAAYAQNVVDLARTAIALERYRLAHGEFPESLDALAPKFISEIPHDVIGGQPLHYRRTDDGQFVLYSVGWNETDDGGVVVLTKGKTPNVDINQGDWVWRYPQK